MFTRASPVKRSSRRCEGLFFCLSSINVKDRKLDLVTLRHRREENHLIFQLDVYNTEKNNVNRSVCVQNTSAAIGFRVGSGLQCNSLERATVNNDERRSSVAKQGRENAILQKESVVLLPFILPSGHTATKSRLPLANFFFFWTSKFEGTQ